LSARDLLMAQLVIMPNEPLEHRDLRGILDLDQLDLVSNRCQRRFQRNSVSWVRLWNLILMAERTAGPTRQAHIPKAFGFELSK
jgi:hypothetical protein